MISDKSTVETNRIGRNSQILEYSIIRKNVIIGDNVIIHPHVTIYDNVEISDNVEIYPGAVIGKLPKEMTVLSRKIQVKDGVRIGESCSIGPNAVIYCGVQMGSNCLIGDAAGIRENCILGDNCLIGMHVSLNYNVVVGNGSIIMAKSHITGNTEIGKDVFISVGVNTANDNSFGAFGYSEDKIKGPIIEDFVKIGVGAVLLPGIHIGENALVAAGSVVTKDVEKNTRVMGIPARVVQYSTGSNSSFTI